MAKPKKKSLQFEFEKYFNKGLDHLQKGKLKAALAAFNKTLKLKPSSVASYINVAVIYLSQGKFDKAKNKLEEALLINNSFPELYLNLGVVAKEQGRLDDALIYYNQALKISPDYAQAMGNIGSVYRDKGRLHEAIRYFKKALKIDPTISDFLYNLGNVYSELGKVELAEKYYNKALDVNPNYFNAYYNLGILYQDRGELEKATKSYFSCLNVNPFYDDCWGNLAMVLQSMCRWDLFTKARQKLRSMTEAAIKSGRRPGEPPFFTVSAYDDPKYAYGIASSWSLDLEKRLKGFKKYSFPKRKGNKIRLGFISDGFRQFPTAQNLLRVLERMNKDKFEIYLFSYGLDDQSTYRKRAEKLADKFVNLAKDNFILAADKIAKHNLDILVDLKGYSRGNRIKIMAVKPAPIIVSYLGYVGTTGSNFIDYLIADRVVIPPKDQKYYSERILYLPNSYWPPDDKTKISKEKFNRSKLGIPKNHFVFASFNQAYKITNETFEVWIAILRKVPKSTMLLWLDNEEAKANIYERIYAAGIEKSRIIFCETLPKEKHLARLRDVVDLALDTSIVNGHTTTSDALWAGVPVVAIYGKHFMSRVSASMLTALGMPELIAKDLKEYERLAIKLAKNNATLKKLKAKLQKNLKTQPLFQTDKYTQNLEKVFEIISRKQVSE